MSDISPYKLFWGWVFNGNPKSPVPSPEVLLKYNSPIHATFLLKSFITHGKLNHYLNTWLNNIGVRYIDREELFFFIKQCVIDFKIKRKDVHYSPYQPKDALLEKIQDKFPTLKPHDVLLYCDIVTKSKDKEALYKAFGVEKPKKYKTPTSKKKQEKVTLKEFLNNNFQSIPVKG
jgi:hypothetical protein